MILYWVRELFVLTGVGEDLIGIGADDEVGRAVGVVRVVIVGDPSTGRLVAVELGRDGMSADGGGEEQAAKIRTTTIKEEL